MVNVVYICILLFPDIFQNKSLLIIKKYARMKLVLLVDLVNFFIPSKHFSYRCTISYTSKHRTFPPEIPSQQRTLPLEICIAWKQGPWVGPSVLKRLVRYNMSKHIISIMSVQKRSTFLGLCIGRWNIFGIPTLHSICSIRGYSLQYCKHQSMISSQFFVYLRYNFFGPFMKSPHYCLNFPLLLIASPHTRHNFRCVWAAA